MEIVNIVILSLSALLLVFVGASRLFNPIATFEKNSGIKLPQDVDLLNETRGVSGAFLIGGIVVALGIFLPQFTFTSFVVGSMLFVGFMIGRMMSMSVDGKPNPKLKQGLIFEIIFGAANVYGLITSMG